MDEIKTDEDVVICIVRKRLIRPRSLQIGERINLYPHEAEELTRLGVVTPITKAISRNAIKEAKTVDAYLKANPKDRAENMSDTRVRELQASLGGPPLPRSRKKRSL